MSHQPNRSLLIVSVPRSGSTALERASLKGLRYLGFRQCGEILNVGHHSKLKIPQYAKKEKHFQRIKERCSKYFESATIRDVIQTNFIVNNLEWLTGHFNIIFLLRPINEIMVSRKRLGWKMPRKTVVRYQNMLRDIPEQNSYRHIDYYDFIQNDPHNLVKLLQEWYPGCPEFTYIDRGFRNKRTRTFISLKKAGVKIQKNC